MIDTLLRFSIARRWVVLFLVLAVAAIGLWNYQRLPIDAVPDITNVQVQINTQAEGYSPLEVEQRITFPVETAIAGLPHIEYTRSLSRLWPIASYGDICGTAPTFSLRGNLINETFAAGQKPTAPPASSRGWGPIATGLV